MKRWQAITTIVKSFNDRERPGYALAALIATLAAPIVLAALALLATR